MVWLSQPIRADMLELLRLNEAVKPGRDCPDDPVAAVDLLSFPVQEVPEVLAGDDLAAALQLGRGRLAPIDVVDDGVLDDVVLSARRTVGIVRLGDDCIVVAEGVRLFRRHVSLNPETRVRDGMVMLIAASHVKDHPVGGLGDLGEDFQRVVHYFSLRKWLD